MNTFRSNLTVYALIALLLYFFSISYAAQNENAALLDNTNINNWYFNLTNDAQGKLEFDNSISSDQNNGSLKLTKVNGLGYLHIKYKDPVKVTKGEVYRFFVEYYSENSTTLTLLLIRVTSDGEHLSYDSRLDTSKGITGQSLLSNSAFGNWSRRVVNYKSEKDEEVFFNIALYGNPCSVNIDNVGYTTEPYKIKSFKPDYTTIPFSKTQLNEILKYRSQSIAKINKNKDCSFLDIDGTNHFCMYKTPRHDAMCPEAFALANIDLMTVVLNMGWAPNNIGRAVIDSDCNIDTALLEETISNQLMRNPNAKLILDFNIFGSAKMLDNNFDHLWANNKGQWAFTDLYNILGYSDDTRLEEKKPDRKGRKNYFIPSLHSPTFRIKSAEAIAKIVRHLQKTDYWKTVVGCFITGGIDGQYMTPNSHYDFSKPAIIAFQKWCEAKYQSIQNLNKIWGSFYESFDEIMPPTPINEGGRGMESLPPYLPECHHSEYANFLLQGSWNLKNYLAKAFKDSADKPVVAMTYGGMPCLTTEGLICSQYIDLSGTLSYYPHRAPGYTLGYHINQSPSLHGKILWQEMDMRSWVGSVYNDEVKQMWMGAGDSPENWKSIQRKLLSVSMAANTGQWYYSMNNYFNDKWISLEIGRAKNVMAVAKYDKTKRWRPDVVVVNDGHSSNHISATHPIFGLGSNPERYHIMQMQSSGVPYDVYSIDDILTNTQLQDYKVYIFVDILKTNPAKTDAINRVLKNNNKIIFWGQDSGYINNGKIDIGSVSDLTEITVKTEQKYSRDIVQLIPSGNGITDGEKPFQGASELLLSAFNLDGKTTYSGRYQLFWVEDSTAEKIAIYHNSKKTAGAMKKFSNWTSIYFGQPYCLGSTMLNNIAQQAGAYRAGKAGQFVQMTDGYVSIHGLLTEEYKLTLPSNYTNLIDIDTAKTIRADKDNSVLLSIECGKTYWYLME